MKGTGTWQSADPRHRRGHLSVVRAPDAGSEVAGWQAECACGWRGTVRRSGPEPRQQAADDDVPRVVRQVLRREWAAHVGTNGTAPVRRAAGQVARAQARLDAAVREARAAGASWAEIGDAAGMTRQSAHERWAGEERGASA